ncbi:MAG: protease [Mycobacteriaceae bacterium]|nr:protease [Mycobacteriaceae bacterium]
MSTMRRRSTAVRRAALACCAALLTAGPAAAVADAAPAHSDLPAALVDALARDLKLSPQQYSQRSDDAQRLGEFEATARKTWPKSFAGVWLDQAGRPTVALAAGPDKAAARRAAESAGFTVADVASSEATLRQEKRNFDIWLATQPTEVSANISGSAIDTVHNTVAVRVDRAAGVSLPGGLDALQLITTARPTAGESVVPSGSRAAAGARPAVIGGQAYAAVAGNRAVRCSIGFNGFDRSGAIVNITAGHCDPNIPAAGTAAAPGMFSISGSAVGEPLGSFTKSVLGGQDYSIVRINAANTARFANNLVAGPPGQPPIPITGVAVPVVGMPACKSGSRTGFSCGTVSSVEQSVQVGNHQLNGSFSMNICALPGDSGGTIVSGTRALGISSASSVADYPICQIPEFIGMLTGDVPQLFAQPLNHVLSANPGLRVRTN